MMLKMAVLMWLRDILGEIMNLRLKTKLEDETKIYELQSGLQVSSRAAVMRLAIGYSLRINEDPRIVDGSFVKYDISKQNGADYNRFTLFNNDELLYKVLMEEKLKIHLSDNEFFPELTYAHIHRGIKELYADYKLAGSRDKLLKKILK